MNDTNECPKCGYTSDVPFDQCPKCRVIIEKFLEKQKILERQKKLEETEKKLKKAEQKLEQAESLSPRQRISWMKKLVVTVGALACGLGIAFVVVLFLTYALVNHASNQSSSNEPAQNKIVQPVNILPSEFAKLIRFPDEYKDKTVKVYNVTLDPNLISKLTDEIYGLTVTCKGVIALSLFQRDELNFVASAEITKELGSVLAHKRRGSPATILARIAEGKGKEGKGVWFAIVQQVAFGDGREAIVIE